MKDISEYVASLSPECIEFLTGVKSLATQKFFEDYCGIEHVVGWLSLSNGQ